MACGNNKITRAYLSAQPSSVAAHLGQIATQAASPVSRREQLVGAIGQVAVNRRRLGEFILPTGQDQRLATSSDRKRYKGQHVHVKRYHDGDPRQVLVQVTDETDKEGSRDGGGHHDFVLFLRNPTRQDVDKAVTEMLATLNSRLRESRR